MTVNAFLFLHAITFHKRLWFLINGLSSSYPQVEVTTKAWSSLWKLQLFMDFTIFIGEIHVLPDFSGLE